VAGPAELDLARERDEDATRSRLFDVTFAQKARTSFSPTGSVAPSAALDSGTAAISAFHVWPGGELEPVPGASGLPPAAVGLAAADRNGNLARAYAQDDLMPRALQANRHEHFDPCAHPRPRPEGIGAFSS
jgi:hypothetical protein